jgi:hypothetical protein
MEGGHPHGTERQSTVEKGRAVVSELETFRCVKPIGGAAMIACDDVAAYQDRTHAHLKWCAPHVEGEHAGHRLDWIPIHSPEAAAKREEYAGLLVRLEAERAARPVYPETLMKLAGELYKYAKETADYNGNGWDVVVECYTEYEIAESLNGETPVPSTLEQAIAAFAPAVDVWSDPQHTVNSAF